MRLPGWNTASPDRPAELVHHSGLVLTPLLYSARADAVDLIPMGPALKLGERALDGSGISWRTSFSGTTLDWHYGLAGDDLTITWHTVEHGEWGLRFWVILCIHGSPTPNLSYDDATGTLTAAPPHAMAVVSAKKPLLVTTHEEVAALAQELEQHGYFYLASRADAGSLLALRFNLEEAPRMSVAVGPAAQRPHLPDAVLPPARSQATQSAQRPLQAVHDVMAWNHVYDDVNRRPYTVLTRNWNVKKFGGFGVWLNDVVYNAWMWGLIDLAKARQNLEAVFAWQTEAGNFPCLVTGNDRWLDRSQPPIVTFVVWSLALRHADKTLLEWAYPALVRNHDWWWRCRQVGDVGLVVYGTSLDVGTGLYKGTKLAAKDESSMDNSAVHDPAPFDEATGLLMSYDVGLNSLLALDAECLALIAEALGKDADAMRFGAAAAAHRAAIGTHLWDERRSVFANRLVGGDFLEPLAPTSFYPMAAGAANAAQTAALVERWLNDEEKFGGWPGLPSAPRDQPAYRDNVYWRGRIWAPLNFWTVMGLERAGQRDAARALRLAGWRLFDECGWCERLCGENYNAQTGAILDSADTDWFYAWGALLPALAVTGAVDATPWDGVSLSRPLGEGQMGSVALLGDRVQVEATADGFRVDRDGALLLETSLTRITNLARDGNAFRFDVPGGGFVRVPGARSAVLDGMPLGVGPDGKIVLPDRAGTLSIER
ncbi:MAG: trehalase family glycosidase [Pseudomonadota bacterium]